MERKTRRLVEILRARLEEPTRFIQVVIGPRQVGKTTALQAVLPPGAVFQTADYPTPLPHSVIGDWWQEAERSPAKILAIDEIQKIPGWTEALKKLWDAGGKKLKVVVTGSSALLVEKGLKETLAGRFELIRAEHWNFQEASDVFGMTLTEFMEYGCYPGSVPLWKQDINRWGQFIRDSIVEPALGRDLLQLHPVDQPALLRQLFGVAVSLPCQIISLQKLQGQLQGKGTLPTLQHYLKLLSDTFLVSGIEKFSPSGFRSKKSSPKLIVHDNALIRAFTRPIQGPIDSETRGRYLENCVGARLIEAGWETYYWKDRDFEVDFVAVGPRNEKYAIEVKTSETNEKELKGLFKFCSLYPDFTAVLVSPIPQPLPGVLDLPAEEILSWHRQY